MLLNDSECIAETDAEATVFASRPVSDSSIAKCKRDNIAHNTLMQQAACQ